MGWASLEGLGTEPAALAGWRQEDASEETGTQAASLAGCLARSFPEGVAERQHGRPSARRHAAGAGRRRCCPRVQQNAPAQHVTRCRPGCITLYPSAASLALPRGTTEGLRRGPGALVCACRGWEEAPAAACWPVVAPGLATCLSPTCTGRRRSHTLLPCIRSLSHSPIVSPDRSQLGREAQRRAPRSCRSSKSPATAHGSFRFPWRD